MLNVLPTSEDVARIARFEWESSESVGWRPKLRERFGYYLPEHHYEATVERLVAPGCRWLDVGGGKSLFPMSPRLSRKLADRAGHLTGVDPDDNLLQNPYVRERFIGLIDDYRSREPFDLATLRMVAEHISNPSAAVASLAQLVRIDGYVVVYTPHRWSPVSIASGVIPNQWHSRITRFLWKTRCEDVFPTCYRMNTRAALTGCFESHGFREVAFQHLENCQVFQRWRLTAHLELLLWKAIHVFGGCYPEVEILAVYQRVESC